MFNNVTALKNSKFQMRFFAKENSVSIKDLEEALLQWRLKSTSTSKTPETPLHPSVIPTFMEQVD
jgi:hypothetical protein